MPSPPQRRRAILLVKTVVSVALLGWLLRRIVMREGMASLGEQLGELHLGWLALAVALHGLAVLSGVLRWSVLLKAQSIELPFGELTRSFLIGRFVGAFTPSTTGLDGYRLWDVARMTGQTGRSTGTIVVEKLVGLLGMTLTAVVLLPLGADRLASTSALPIAAMLLAGSALGLFLFVHPVGNRWLLRGCPERFVPRVRRILASLRGEGLSALVLARAVGLGLATHVALSAVFLATGYALGLAIGPFELLVVGNAIIFATLLPISIGGVGVRESVAVAMLALIGVGPTAALLVALLGYLTGQVPALVGGAWMLAQNRQQQSAPAVVLLDVARPPAL